MWSDNETTRDFLNFKHVADIVAEIIVSANGKPLSIGVSGGWGVGKSSMVRLIGEALKAKSGRAFVVVEFNAWLYQGYDDVRAALIEIIARDLLKYAEKNKKPLEHAKELLARVDWVRAIGLTAGSAVSLFARLPPIGLLGEGLRAYQALTDGDIESSEIENATSTGKQVVSEGASLLKPAKKAPSPPREIQALRDHFKATLEQLDITLVVLIDDLDSCLPHTRDGVRPLMPWDVEQAHAPLGEIWNCSAYEAAQNVAANFSRLVTEANRFPLTLGV
jgi:predicted KAP-like P-loop ATPase